MPKLTEHKGLVKGMNGEHLDARGVRAFLTHCPHDFLNDLKKSIEEQIKNMEI